VNIIINYSDTIRLVDRFVQNLRRTTSRTLDSLLRLTSVRLLISLAKARRRNTYTATSARTATNNVRVDSARNAVFNLDVELRKVVDGVNAVIVVKNKRI
jgi:hypothetical protein